MGHAPQKPRSKAIARFGGEGISFSLNPRLEGSERWSNDGKSSRTNEFDNSVRDDSSLPVRQLLVNTL